MSLVFGNRPAGFTTSEVVRCQAALQKARRVESGQTAFRTDEKKRCPAVEPGLDGCGGWMRVSSKEPLEYRWNIGGFSDGAQDSASVV